MPGSCSGLSKGWLRHEELRPQWGVPNGKTDAGQLAYNEIRRLISTASSAPAHFSEKRTLLAESKCRARQCARPCELFSGKDW